ncbi:MAG: hypothetical protein BGO43_05750 [Gammaproteobacteria bacterium 39-13]|nr:alpha/beta fold hydrolase [Gammaproteobacteria bacterium]OJV91542.1 MAG: hypothetical protein BGO43_05750 [Gammaproteobacteria bacterium 39-13]
MATYILIHGAWHGAWCWEKVVPLLEAKGHTVYAPDLPGHSQDATPLKVITLDHYVDCVCRILSDCLEPVILVGHSLAGVVISQVGELMPEKIKKLIYLAAFLPLNGQSMFEVAKLQPPSRFVKMMKRVPEENAFYFPAKMLKGFACHLCTDEIIERIKTRLCVEPLLPSDTAVCLSDERFGQLPRCYIECLQDQAIHLETQRKMVALTPCEVLTLNCDHSPFYSDPEGLAEILIQATC